jgi:hypothetical protein
VLKWTDIDGDSEQMGVDLKPYTRLPALLSTLNSSLIAVIMPFNKGLQTTKIRRPNRPIIMEARCYQRSRVDGEYILSTICRRLVLSSRKRISDANNCWSSFSAQSSTTEFESFDLLYDHYFGILRWCGL